MDTNHILAVSAFKIRACGWTSKARAVFADAPQATAEIVLKDLPHVTPTEEDRRTARAVREWVRGIIPKNSFERALAEALAQDDVDERRVGLVAAAVMAFYRHQTRAAHGKEWELARVHSTHQGSIGVRQVWDLTVLSRKTYNFIYLYHFVDRNHNLFLSFRSGLLVHPEDGRLVEVGEEIRVRGTVQRHDVFHDTFQTVLGRVTVWTKCLPQSTR